MASLALKRLALGAAETFGLNAWVRRRLNGSLTVLCYHGVVHDDRAGDRFRFGNTESAARFAAQLDYLCRHFTPLPAAGLLAYAAGERPLPPRSVVITFDDGYRNNLTQAAPILLRKGVPAIFHLSTGYIGSRHILWPDEVLLRLLDWEAPTIEFPQPGAALAFPATPAARRQEARRIKEACKRLPVAQREEFLAYLRRHTPAVPSGYDAEAHDFLDWDEVRRLAGQGFEIGSHTVSHPILTSLPAAGVPAELADSRAAIERETGRPVRILAYPNGTPADYSPGVQAAAGESGYALAFAVEDRRASARPDLFAIPRLGISGHVPLAVFQAKVSGLREVLGG